MAPVLAVRSTFLHVEASDSDAESDCEVLESAATHVRSLKRAHTTQGSAPVGPRAGEERGELTPSTSGTEGQEEAEEPFSDCDDQQHRERTATYDAFESTPQRRVTRCSTYDAFEATPQRRVTRCSTFDAFECTPRAEETARPGNFESEERTAAQWPPFVPDAAPPLAQEAAQQPGPQAVAVQGVAAQAFAPQALVMAMPMGFPPLCMPAAFVAQQELPMQQKPQQPPSGPPAAAMRRGAEGQDPLAQQSGQQQLKQCPAAAAPPRTSTTGNKAVACASLPGGGARVSWDVDARRFASHDSTVVSPAFVLDLPGFGAHNFKVVVHAAGTRGSRGGIGFRVAKGRGRVELKCDAHVPRPGQDSHAGEEFVMVLDKREGVRLGVDLASEDGEPWRVKAVTGGLFEQWNLANPSCPVAPGDRIISANGVRGSAAQVREQCSKVGTLRLVVRRGRADAPRFQVLFGVGRGGCAFGCEAPAMRGPVLHDFAGQSCCGLRRADGDDEFDLQEAADRASRKVAIHIDVLPLSPA